MDKSKAQNWDLLFKHCYILEKFKCHHKYWQFKGRVENFGPNILQNHLFLKKRYKDAICAGISFFFFLFFFILYFFFYF